MVQVNSYTKHYHRTFQKKVGEFNKSRELPPHIGSMIGKKTCVSIAEVGCALVNTLGDSWKDVKVKIVCSDKYADEFNALWEEFDETPLHPIEKEDMENLSYKDQSFDIVHCRNALDHTRDPKAAIDEFKRVSSDWVYLEHAQNQKSTYGGHHYWDITLEDGQTVFDNGSERFVLEGFRSFMKGDLVVSVWFRK